MVRIPNIDFIFLNNQEFTTKASDYEHGENNPSDTQQETLNPFDVYSDIYAQLNNGKTSELNNETFNKIIGVSPRIYSNYSKGRFMVSEQDFEIINNNLITLYELTEKVGKYKKNKKPTGNPVLKLSIWK